MNLLKGRIGALYWGGSLLALTAFGCGAKQPSQELVNARSAYERASTGQAAELVPADVYTARKSLERAEKAHEDDANSFEARSRAYIAERKAMSAIAKAQSREARRQVEAAEQQRLSVLESQRDSARLTLDETSAELERVRREMQTGNEELRNQLAQRARELEARQRELEDARRQRERAEQQVTAAVESLRQVGMVRSEARGTVLTLSGSVLFPFGKAELFPAAKQRLDQVATALANIERPVEIEGYTDAIGSDANNLALSRERANAVRDYLIQRGVPSEKLKARGLGETNPIASNDTAEGRANNRRVELVFPRAGQRQTSAEQRRPAPTERGSEPGEAAGWSDAPAESDSAKEQQK
jgi:outer membrane protein OmpA-like peptidoglycan-associated protein